MSSAGFFPPLGVTRGPSHLPPGHTLQEHGLGGAEFLWVQAVSDTAVTLTLRIVGTLLSDPLKQPDSVYLPQGSLADPVPREAFSIQILPLPSLAVLNQPPFNSRHVVWPGKGEDGKGRRQ